jgi:hypothetical protein
MLGQSWYRPDKILETFQILIEEVYGNCVLSVWGLHVDEMMHSNQELANMHFVYSLAGSNAVVTHCTKKCIQDKDVW